ncbi:MAG: Holliday junction resolvase RuvX [Burkholderiales bacterium]|nr:Holliday junction resolvase RuvX [Burkholderiales bacterium]
MNPSVHTVLGIDYGLKRIGVAVGNTLTRHAEPLVIIQNTSETNSIQRICQMAREWSAHELVLGLPRHPDGTPHEMTQICLDMQQSLMKATQLSVYLIDERYSSAVLSHSTQTNARGQTRAKPQDDLAAAIILQQYLDAH